MSLTDSTDSIYDISEPSFSFGKTDKPFNFFMFIILIIIFFIIIIPWNKLNLANNNLEGMTGGTLTQLFANDSQDVYLKSNVDKLATGNFNLFWNQPTRIANTFQNRGSPLDSIYLPDTSMNPNPYALEVSNDYANNILNKRAKKVNYIPNPILQNSPNNNSDLSIKKNILPSGLPLPPNPNNPANPANPPNPPNPPNPYELDFVGKQIAKTEQQANNLPVMTHWTGTDYLYQGLYDNLLYNKNCIGDPSSCGGGAGGYRLGEDFVEPSKALDNVNISGNTFYPDSYVGSYFHTPNFDIVKPYPFIPSTNKV